MKKSFVLGLVLALGTLAYVPQLAISAENGKVDSLRDDHPIKEISEKTDWKKFPPSFHSVGHDSVPLIPHFIEGYRITLKLNKCLSCHDSEIGSSHFQDRDGNVLDKVDSRRYFCTSCHVPQVDAKPLRENTFEKSF